MQENKNKLPIINEEDRAYMVRNLKQVTKVKIIDSLQEYCDYITYIIDLHLFQDAKIVVFKNHNKIYGMEVICNPNATLILIPDVKRFESTTEIVNYLK